MGGVSPMSDPLRPEERSALMSKVRGKGNRSTELRVASALRRNKVNGWRRQLTDIHGKPDFFFPEFRLALFIDGCFWHYCPRCDRNIPSTRREYWKDKLENNRRRDQRVTRYLHRKGYHVMRIWEHSLKDERWVGRLTRLMRKIEVQA